MVATARLSSLLSSLMKDGNMGLLAKQTACGVNGVLNVGAVCHMCSMFCV